VNAPNDPIVVGAGGKPAGNKRLMVMIGAGAALLMLVLVVPKVLGGGGSGDAGVTQAGGATAPTSTPVTTVPVSSGKPASSSSKNPFLPLISASAGGSSTPSGMDASNTSVVNPVDAGITTPGTGTTTPTSTTSTSGVRFDLLEVLDSVEARVRVGDDIYQVGVDAIFAGSFRVSSLDVSTRCGTFVYGDRRIALCEGEEAIV
jgi:hypothetical protein